MREYAQYLEAIPSALNIKVVHDLRRPSSKIRTSRIVDAELDAHMKAPVAPREEPARRSLNNGTAPWFVHVGLSYDTDEAVWTAHDHTSLNTYINDMMGVAHRSGGALMAGQVGQFGDKYRLGIGFKDRVSALRFIDVCFSMQTEYLH